MAELKDASTDIAAVEVKTITLRTQKAAPSRTVQKLRLEKQIREQYRYTTLYCDESPTEQNWVYTNQRRRMTRADAGRGDGRSALPERQNKPINTADGDGAVRDRRIWWTGQLEAPEEVTSQLSQEGMTKLIMVVVVVGGGSRRSGDHQDDPSREWW